MYTIQLCCINVETSNNDLLDQPEKTFSRYKFTLKLIQQEKLLIPYVHSFGGNTHFRGRSVKKRSWRSQRLEIVKDQASNPKGFGLYPEDY